MRPRSFVSRLGILRRGRPLSPSCRSSPLVGVTSCRRQAGRASLLRRRSASARGAGVRTLRGGGVAGLNRYVTRSPQGAPAEVGARLRSEAQPVGTRVAAGGVGARWEGDCGQLRPPSARPPRGPPQLLSVYFRGFASCGVTWVPTPASPESTGASLLPTAFPRALPRFEVFPGCLSNRATPPSCPYPGTPTLASLAQRHSTCFSTLPRHPAARFLLRWKGILSIAFISSREPPFPDPLN